MIAAWQCCSVPSVRSTPSADTRSTGPSVPHRDRCDLGSAHGATPPARRGGRGPVAGRLGGRDPRRDAPRLRRSPPCSPRSRCSVRGPRIGLARGTAIPISGSASARRPHGCGPTVAPPSSRSVRSLRNSDRTRAASRPHSEWGPSACLLRRTHGRRRGPSTHWLLSGLTPFGLGQTDAPVHRVNDVSAAPPRGRGQSPRLVRRGVMLGLSSRRAPCGQLVWIAGAEVGAGRVRLGLSSPTRPSLRLDLPVLSGMVHRLRSPLGFASGLIGKVAQSASCRHR